MMGAVDFIVPLKQVGLITRSVLEAIREFYQPRRIIVVTRKAEGAILRKLSPFWRCGVIETIDEETFFVPNFNLTFEDIVSEYDANRPGDQREPGWWIQQLIKLGAGTQIPNVSPTYVVWDGTCVTGREQELSFLTRNDFFLSPGDLVPTRRWRLCSKDEHGNPRYHIAILQGESRSEFNTTQYANCMRALIGYTPLEPTEGGTYVAHHMVFETRYVREMLDLMAEKTASLEPWPIMIMASSRKFYRFSEYKTYATFMLKHHPRDFNYHELAHFGDGGLRFREANNIIDDMLKACRVVDGGIAYSDVADYVLSNWMKLTTPGQCMPAYIQLDHVYGLDGIDLNLSAPEGPSSSSASAVVTPPSAPGDDDVAVGHSPAASGIKRLTVASKDNSDCMSSLKQAAAASASDSDSDSVAQVKATEACASILPAKRPWVCVT